MSCATDTCGMVPDYKVGAIWVCKDCLLETCREALSMTNVVLIERWSSDVLESVAAELGCALKITLEKP